MPPIQVSMSFESFEDAITALAKLRIPEAKTAAVTGTVAADLAPEKEAPKPGPGRPAKPAARPPAPPPAAETTTPALDYDTEVGPAIAAAVVTNRAEVVEVLTRFGAKTGKQLKPEQYAEFLEQLQTRIEASAASLA